MAGLIGFSIPAIIILTTMAYMWKFFLLCFALWLSIHLAVKYTDYQRYKHQAKEKTVKAIIDRAYQQHYAVLDGELEKGVFGNYPPPKGLRDLP